MCGSWVGRLGSAGAGDGRSWSRRGASFLTAGTVGDVRSMASVMASGPGVALVHEGREVCGEAAVDVAQVPLEIVGVEAVLHGELREGAARGARVAQADQAFGVAGVEAVMAVSVEGQGILQVPGRVGCIVGYGAEVVSGQFAHAGLLFLRRVKRNQSLNW